ncbi:MAG: hypothetical protein KAI70_05495, partial [Candidatus Omnitrophica bacterium]|nr:hypothetical protein [Candidatus Omnitrophota bacterium]
PTQSLEDGETYPVRYYFPEYKRAGAQKKLDLDRIGEMKASLPSKTSSFVIEANEKYTIEQLPGGFGDKGLEVNRIILKAGAELNLSDISSFHNLVSVEGKAEVVTRDGCFEVPKALSGGKMLIVPAAAVTFTIKAHTKCRIIDTFTPV